MKKGLKIFIVVIAVISILATTGFFYVKSRPIADIETGAVDLTNVQDGSYTGEYKSGPVRAIVTVDVVANKISAVKIVKHECGLGKKAEKITEDIVKAQSPDVDVVSGATLSSRVISKAVQLALKSGVK